MWTRKYSNSFDRYFPKLNPRCSGLSFGILDHWYSGSSRILFSLLWIIHVDSSIILVSYFVSTPILLTVIFRSSILDAQVFRPVFWIIGILDHPEYYFHYCGSSMWTRQSSRNSTTKPSQTRSQQPHPPRLCLKFLWTRQSSPFSYFVSIPISFTFIFRTSTTFQVWDHLRTVPVSYIF